MTYFSAQQFNYESYDWKKMSPDQRKEIINKMSPEERMHLLKQFKEEMIISELDIPAEKQAEFKGLYSEYQEKQKEIKNKFQPEKDYDSLSDDEAQKKLNESFETGQQLLNNRKIYAEKFLKIIKPQQVLQLYQTEGMMRNKVIDNLKNKKKDK